ncbi:MAG: hypothetical protein ABI759_21835 [Candidatus Solibacter sp.]
MRSIFFTGLDLGQRQDPTALAVVEWKEYAGAWDAAAFTHRRETSLSLRHLERIPLGTSYPDVVERVISVMQSRTMQSAERTHLIVDGTGVGPPVVDLLRSRDLGGAKLWPVTITGGDSERYADGYYRVPKRDLIVGLQVLVQQGRLQIASGMREGTELVKEMSEMRLKVTGAGSERYGADRSGEHDDLVLAVSLACWGVKKGATPVRRPQCALVF